MSTNWLRQNEISGALLCLLFLSQILPAYIMWAFSCMIIILNLGLKRGRIRMWRMPGSCPFWILFVLGVVMAVISNRVQFFSWLVFRDIVRMLYIPTYWYLACITCYREKCDYRVLYKTFYLFAGLLCGYELFFRLLNYVQNMNVQMIFRTFVSQGMVNEFVIALATFLVFFKPECNRGYYLSKKMDRLFNIIIISSFALSFSRTSFLILALLILMVGLKNAKATVKVAFVGAIAAILVVILLPGIVSTFIDKIEFSSVEVLSNRTYWDNASIVHGWRGYEVFCAKETYSGFSYLNKIFGGGFGTTVDVHGYAFLVTSEEMLPYLHNGYYTNLVKFGVLGIVITIAYFASYLLFCKRNSWGDYNSRLTIALSVSLIITMFFIHGIFWGQASLVISIPFAWAVMRNSYREKQN